MEIIVFIVLISIVSNIIRAIGKAGTSTPKGGGPYEIPKGREFMEPQTRQRPIAPRKKVRVSIEELPKSQPGPGANMTAASREGIGPERSPKPLRSVVDAPKPAVAKPEPYSELKDLTPERLVEGIILSEILAPPKSRR